mmetsp:Transcript_33425/g.62619  ORF Transcript_33425/g.62619 Transcript_33425/m.62619 type:complete len:226 (+) Transcript_33425:1353-2030(+)
MVRGDHSIHWQRPRSLRFYHVGGLPRLPPKRGTTKAPPNVLDGLVHARYLSFHGPAATADLQVADGGLHVSYPDLGSLDRNPADQRLGSTLHGVGGRNLRAPLVSFDAGAGKGLRGDLRCGPYPTLGTSVPCSMVQLRGPGLGRRCLHQPSAASVEVFCHVALGWMLGVDSMGGVVRGFLCVLLPLPSAHRFLDCATTAQGSCLGLCRYFEQHDHRYVHGAFPLP